MASSDPAAPVYSPSASSTSVALKGYAATTPAGSTNTPSVPSDYVLSDPPPEYTTDPPPEYTTDPPPSFTSVMTTNSAMPVPEDSAQ